jgi:hypothetical protein
MSLALATKGVLSDFTGVGGSGETIYVLEEFNVEVGAENVDIAVTELDPIALTISEIQINIDLDDDQAEVIINDDSIDIEV